MLQLIMGTAGTGKTTQLIEKIKSAAERESPVILLVPEQYSFEAERLVHRALDARKALRVEVLSFTRLCHTIFREYGGLAGVAVSDAGKYMLMSVALEELKDTLQVYRKSAANTGFLQTLVSACGELKSAGITPQLLEDLAEQCEIPALRDKLAELGLIYGAYQGLLDKGYADPEDDLIRAVRLLGERTFFSGVHVFVDGFTTFMAAEFALLDRIIAQAEEAVFAMTADALHDPQKGTGVFSPVKSAAARLIRYANAAGVKVAAPEVLQTPHRYRHPALEHISRHFLQPVAPACTEETGKAVNLYQGADVYREMEHVAAQVNLLVQDEGYRYREIAVVARDPEPYHRAIQTAFARYRVPYFTSVREEVENLPLMSGLLSALDAVRSNFDSEAVLTYAKSPITGLEASAVASLENYCYSWGVRGAVWTAPFINNPRGLAETLTEEDAKLLQGINATREQVTAPLAALKEALRKSSGKRFAKGIFAFLQSVRATEHLTRYAEAMEQGNRESFLEESAQLWDVLMEILDVFGSVLGGVGLQTGRACELFRLAVNTAEVAQVPQTLDQVLVGAADRIRPGEVRAVFVIGANEGVFPAQCGNAGLFTDTERQQMIELGAELSPPTLQQSVLERFYSYFAATLPGERLFVSWSQCDPMGREQQPSVLVSGLELLFPTIGTSQPDVYTLLGGDKPALELLAAHIREDTPMTAALLAHFANGEAVRSVNHIRDAALRAPHRLTDREGAKALFGDSFRLSPSRVERYYRCPFSYFAADGLSLKKRRRVEFSPLESGSVIHNVLQVMVQRHGGRGLAELPQKELANEIKEVIQDYLTQRVESLEALPARFKYLFTRLSGMLARLLSHLGEEFAQSAFEPVAVELPISQREGVPPLRLQTVDGRSVSVEGVVDRVDVMQKRGQRYVRVVDYKSGSKDFKVHDILYGLNLQMLLYLFTIQENGTGPLADAIPAGVLYMPVRQDYISTGRNASPEELKQEQERQWRMNGLILEDEEVLRGMEQDIAGVFIPAKLGKGGSLDAKSSVASKAEMGRLAGKVKELIVNMAQALSQGEIAACPTQGGDYDVCAYCDYRPVCGFEPGDAVRTVAKIDRKEFFKLLEEEENA